VGKRVRIVPMRRKQEIGPVELFEKKIVIVEEENIAIGEQYFVEALPEEIAHEYRLQRPAKQVEVDVGIFFIEAFNERVVFKGTDGDQTDTGKVALCRDRPVVSHQYLQRYGRIIFL